MAVILAFPLPLQHFLLQHFLFPTFPLSRFLSSTSSSTLSPLAFLPPHNCSPQHFFLQPFLHPTLPLQHFLLCTSSSPHFLLWPFLLPTIPPPRSSPFSPFSTPLLPLQHFLSHTSSPALPPMHFPFPILPPLALSSPHTSPPALPPMHFLSWYFLLPAFLFPTWPGSPDPGAALHSSLSGPLPLPRKAVSSLSSHFSQAVFLSFSSGAPSTICF